MIVLESKKHQSWQYRESLTKHHSPSRNAFLLEFSGIEMEYFEKNGLEKGDDNNGRKHRGERE
jgi:hypothetical protein